MGPWQIGLVWCSGADPDLKAGQSDGIAVGVGGNRQDPVGDHSGGVRGGAINDDCAW